MVKKMLTFKEAHEEYGIPINLVYSLVKDDVLTAYQFAGKTRRLKRDDIERWIESTKVVKTKTLFRYNDWNAVENKR